METVDVAVVGAGPVGLLAANLLGLAGHRVVVLERDADVTDEPRAVSVDDEAMRTLQAAGLAADAERLVVPGTGTRYISGRGGTLTYARPSTRPRGFAPKNPVHQPDLVRFLLRATERFPHVDVRFGQPCTAFEQDGDGVVVEVAAGRRTRKLAAQFVLGCDGGRSTVRRILDVPLVGSSFEQRWLVVDVVHDHHDQRFAMHYGDPRRPHVVIAGRDGRCRYEFMLLPEDDLDAVTELATVQRLLAPFRTIEQADIERAVVYTFHALVADRWRTGRVLLAGDAAHMMPPFAGQGLNTGIRDVQNVTWKLDLVLRGGADLTFLDTYEQERRPHAQAMIDLSTRLGGVVMTTDRRKAAARDTLAWLANRFGPTRRFLRDMRFKPAPRFDAGFLRRSPALGRDDRAGHMFDQPPVLLPDGSCRLLDDVLGPGFALLAGDTDGRCALDRLADPRWDELAVTRVRAVLGDRMPLDDGRPTVADLDAGLERALAPAPGRVWLLRPDRYVLAVFDPAEERAVLDWVAAAGVRSGAVGAAASVVQKTE